jgi:RNA polymerase sigma-70 factor (ECF subfamily)
MPELFNIERTLDAVLGGQPDAFLAVVREFGPSLRTYLGTQLFHQDEVEDLTQEVFITAYQRLHTFRREENFGAWLRGISRNKLLKHYEQSRRRNDTMDRFRQEAASLLTAELERKADATKEAHLQALLCCIHKLPERMRKVVRGWLDGTRAAALVEELRLSAANIYQIQHRASELLRDCVTKEVAHAE